MTDPNPYAMIMVCHSPSIRWSPKCHGGTSKSSNLLKDFPPTKTIQPAIGVPSMYGNPQSTPVMKGIHLHMKTYAIMAMMVFPVFVDDTHTVKVVEIQHKAVLESAQKRARSSVNSGKTSENGDIHTYIYIYTYVEMNMYVYIHIYIHI